MPFNQRVFVRDGVKSIISIPWSVDQLQYGQQQRDRIKAEDDAYAKVPLLFRALNVRCNTLASVPYKIYDEAGKEVDEYPYEEMQPLNDLIWKTEASLLLRGASFVIRLADAAGTEIGLQWLNPFTMNVKNINAQSSQIGFQQHVNGKVYPQAAPGYWTTDEVFYLRQFSASDDVGFGTSAASVALGSSRLQHYLTFFASQFFENGAMPVTMLSFPAGTQQPERERVEGFFKKTMQGIRNAFRVVAVSGDIKASILTPPLSTLAIPGLKEHAIDDIAWAFDIPKSVLTADSANYATAESEMQNFLYHTICPRCTFFEHQFNNKLLKDYGLRLEFHPQEMSEMQEDEAKRSVAFRNYTLSGMTPQMAAAVLGIDIPKDFEAEWGNAQTTPIDKKGTIVPPSPIAPNEGGPDDAQKSMRDDLGRWQRKAIKRLAEGKSARVEFQSDHISDEIKSAVTALLEEAKTEETVKQIFSEASKL